MGRLGGETETEGVSRRPRLDVLHKARHLPRVLLVVLEVPLSRTRGRRRDGPSALQKRPRRSFFPWAGAADGPFGLRWQGGPGRAGPYTPGGHLPRAEVVRSDVDGVSGDDDEVLQSLEALSGRRAGKFATEMREEGVSLGSARVIRGAVPSLKAVVEKRG